jgi:hypothetical protein
MDHAAHAHAHPATPKGRQATCSQGFPLCMVMGWREESHGVAPSSTFPSHQIQSLLQKVTHTAQFVGTTLTVLYPGSPFRRHTVRRRSIFLLLLQDRTTLLLGHFVGWLSLTFKIQMNAQLGKQQRTSFISWCLALSIL